MTENFPTEEHGLTADRRALITGIGVVAPTGTGIEEHWQSCLAGTSAIAVDPQYREHGYRSTLSARIQDFAADAYIPKRLVVQTDRWTQLGLAAVSLALQDAKIDVTERPPFDVGVVTASSSGGNEYGQQQIQNLWALDPTYVTAYQSIAWFYAATTGQVSIRHGTKGPSGVVVAEQAAGLDALAQARRVLRTGTGLMLAGGTEAPLSPYAHACQESAGRLSAAGYRPFDPQADGYVPGEGGAMFTVESAESAATRPGAVVYGELAGHGSTFDPPPGSGLPSGLARAMELALADAGVTAGEVDVVFADAAAIPELDRAEAAALATVFGPHGVPVTAIKPAAGRLYAGGAALDVATALLAMRDGVVPPTAGVRAPDPEHRLDLVCGAPRDLSVDTVLVAARGYGGFNSALVLRRHDDD